MRRKIDKKGNRIYESHVLYLPLGVLFQIDSLKTGEFVFLEQKKKALQTFSRTQPSDVRM
jgi:hypothetical protein